MALKNGLLYFLSQLIPAILAIVTLAVYTRWLSEAAYGVYSLVIVVVGLSNTLLFNWLYVAIYRFWNDGRLSATELSRIAVVSLLLMSVLCSVLAAGYALFSGHYRESLAVVLLLISGATFTAFQRVNAITNAAGNYLAMEIFRALLGGGLAISLVWQGYDWFGIVIGVTLGNLLVLALSGPFRRFIRVDSLQLDKTLVSGLLQYGLPLSLTFVLLEVIHLSDRVLLGLLVDAETVGHYAVAFSLPQQLMIMVAYSISLVLYPAIIRSFEEQGADAAAERLADYLLVFTGLLLPACLGLLALRHDWVPLIIGQDFISTTVALLPWVALAMLLNVYYLFYIAYAFQLSQQTAATIRIVLAAVLVNSLLNGAMIPFWGIWGALTATIASYAVCVFAGYWSGRRYFPLIINWTALSKITVAALVMSLFLESLPLNPGLSTGLVKVVLGIPVYALLILFLNPGNIRSLLRNRDYLPRFLSL